MENIYTFIGKDESYNLNQIQNKINELNIENSEVIKFDLSESSVFSLLEELNTSSFFVTNKVVILYNINPELNDDRLIKYLLNPNPTTYLFVSIKDDSYKLYEVLKKNSLISQSTVLKPEEFLDYVVKYSNSLGYNMDIDAAKEIVSRSLEDYNLLNNNLSKVLIYKYDSKNIVLNDVDQLVTKNLDDNIFNLVEEVIKNNKKKAYELYLGLKEQNVDDASILGSLIYKFKEMAITKRLIEDKLTKADIAQTLNVKEGRAYYMIKNVSNVSYEYLTKKLNKLLDIDYKSKTGLANLAQQLELFLIS